MAAGAVGGYFGGRLAAAGHDVVFIARGAHPDGRRAHGLRFESRLGDLHLPTVDVTDDPSAVAPVDIVLFAVKLWDTAAAGAALAPLVTRGTRVITFQNGVDSVPQLTPILGAEVVVGGTAMIAAVIKEPGVVVHASKFAALRCGWLDGRPDAGLDAFVATATAAGIDIAHSANMQRELWQKFVFLVGLSGATGITRMPIGAVLADPDGRAMLRGILEETVAVGRAAGIDLAPDYAQDRFRHVETMPYGTKASLLHDVERGNRLEIDWLAGHVVELGREHGIPTPMNAAVYAALKLHRHGAAR